MIQISLTQKQLDLIKDALDSFDSGFLETEQECTEFNGLKQYIDYRFMQQAKEEKRFAEIGVKVKCNKCHGTGRTSRMLGGTLKYEVCDKCNGKGVIEHG
jgi:DnaJ-class molecular chaperone